MSTTSKFLFLFRNPQGSPARSPSPDEMQAMYAAWGTWKAKFEKELIPGSALKPGGVTVKGGTVTDGPFIETKEIIASYAMVETSSLARAVEIAKECPINDVPGGSIEIRELGGY